MQEHTPIFIYLYIDRDRQRQERVLGFSHLDLFRT